MRAACRTRTALTRPRRGATPGRDSTVPTEIRLGFVIPFSAASAETLMPLRAAIAPRVSPGRTR